VSDKPNVLVLFYDGKDSVRPSVIEGFKGTLETAVEFGFVGTGVGYDICMASPSHEDWLVTDIMNQRKYDGIIVVAGLSCTLDMPHMLMRKLYNYPEVEIKSAEWGIDEKVKSKYYGQPRHVPIIGVPIKTSGDRNGWLSFASMVSASRPSEAACLAPEQGYEAARLMAKMLTNEWNDVHIITPHLAGAAYDVGTSISIRLNKMFDLYGDCNIKFGVQPLSKYEGKLFEERERLASNILPVCVYDDLSQLKNISEIADCVIGVFAPEESSLSKEEEIYSKEFVKNITGIKNVVHSRGGSGANAAESIAQYLSVHSYQKPVKEQVPDPNDPKNTIMKTRYETVWLNPNGFKESRMDKSRENVERHLKSRKR